MLGLVNTTTEMWTNKLNMGSCHMYVPHGVHQWGHIYVNNNNIYIYIYIDINMYTNMYIDMHAWSHLHGSPNKITYVGSMHPNHAIVCRDSKHKE